MERKKIEKEINQIIGKIKNLSNLQQLILEYTHNKNNTHIMAGAITLIGVGFLTLKLTDLSLLQTLIASTIPATGVSLGVKEYYEIIKKKKYEKQYPNINFKLYDENPEKINEISQEITDLLEQCAYLEENLSYENTNETKKINNIESVYNENNIINEKPKVLVKRK